MAKRNQQLDTWSQLNARAPVRYTCGWCDSLVGATVGFDYVDGGGAALSAVRLCPNCNYPTFLDPMGTVVPESPYGEQVEHLSSDLAGLYGEARNCVSVGATHAAVMVGRKIIMHVAVDKGAKENQGFGAYVDYLVKNNLVPPDTEGWVDEIRQLGNDANHEIFDIGTDEAKATVDFVAMLLRLLYEYPAKGAASVAARAAKDAK